jgi:GT2 family glycosyltransferase
MTAAIDVVVPVHNRWQLTQKCLASLIEQTVPHRVVVVDNGSTDETPRRIAGEFPEARTILLAANLGF